MKRLLAPLRAAFLDPLYLRVVVALIGLLLLSGAGWIGVALHPDSASQWFGMLLPLALGAFGLYLFGVSAWGSEERFERAMRYADASGDIAGLVLMLTVGLLALPITMLLRQFRKDRA